MSILVADMDGAFTSRALIYSEYSETPFYSPITLGGMREVTFMENIFVNAPISCDNLRRDGGSCCYILCFSLSYFDEINNRHGMAI